MTRALATDAEGLVAFLGDQRDAFEKANVPKGADGQVSSVARRFALIAAAGELGIGFGVLPWEKGAAIKAAQAGFRAWLNSRGGAGAGEDVAAVAAVRRFIEMHDESRFTTIFPNGDRMIRDTDGDMEVAGGRATINRVGFRRRGADGWEYLILPEAWKDEVCKGLDHVRAANVLKDAGLLVSGEGRHLMPKVAIAGYGRPRVYFVKGAILGGSDE